MRSGQFPCLYANVETEYTCIYMRMHMYMHKCMHVCTCTCMRLYMHACTCTCMHVPVHACMHMYMHLCTCTCICMCMCAHTCTCIFFGVLFPCNVCRELARQMLERVTQTLPQWLHPVQDLHRNPASVTLLVNDIKSRRETMMQELSRCYSKFLIPF